MRDHEVAKATGSDVATMDFEAVLQSLLNLADINTLM